jgi:acetyl esterase/lipase
MTRYVATFVALLLILGGSHAKAQEERISADVIYGHKFGMALTLDVFKPAGEANGAAVLFMVSGGWYSHWVPAKDMANMFVPLTSRGFTVFAVRHGSSPKFTIPEAVDDVRRAVRFIRHNADDFGIDPDRIGVYGASAGGHLSLMLGTTADEGDPKAADPVLRESSRVHAVVALVAPSDIKRAAWSAEGHLPAYDGFPALNLDQETAASVSPLDFVTKDDAPALLIAGDKDTLVPITHSEEIHAEFQKVKVPSKLSVVEGAGHGFNGQQMLRAGQEMCDWFEEHLLDDKESEKETDEAAASGEAP